MNANDAYFTTRHDWQFENLAAKDLGDVIDDMDENVALRLLAQIGNLAHWLVNNGDTSDKIELAAEIGKLFAPHIAGWVDEQVELSEQVRP